MADSKNHDPKGGNLGGSRANVKNNAVCRSDAAATDETERKGRIKADDIAADDPHKVEKLTRHGRTDVDPDEGSD